jgi:hypothetical protein
VIPGRGVLPRPMDLSPASLLTSLLVGGVGYVLFSYGRKANRPPHLITGLTLFVVTWVAPTPLSSVGVSCVLLAALWFAVKRMGL